MPGRWMGAAAAAVLFAGLAMLPGRGAAGPAVEKGYRAFAVPLDADQLHGLKPGDRVDVLMTFEASVKDGKEWVTATILQNVAVLDVRFQDGRQIGTVVLSLNPNEAQYAALAVDSGRKLRVAARAEGDAELKPMEMASLRKLFR